MFLQVLARRCRFEMVLQARRRRRHHTLQLECGNLMLVARDSSLQLHNVSDVSILLSSLFSQLQSLYLYHKLLLLVVWGNFVTVDVFGLIKWIWSSTMRAWFTKRVLFVQELARRTFSRSFQRLLVGVVF